MTTQQEAEQEGSKEDPGDSPWLTCTECQVWGLQLGPGPRLPLPAVQG